MKIRLAVLCIVLFLASPRLVSAQTSQIKKGMIQLTAFYPGGEGKSFNMDYYVKKHIHMLDSLSGGALKVVTVDKGVPGLGSEAPRYLAIGHFYFENIAAFQNSLALHFKEIMADIPNYTNIQPVFQFSEVVK